MKKIILCGATKGSNFGDVLFAYFFLKRIKEVLPDSQVSFYKMGSFGKSIQGMKEAGLYDKLSADALVYISGGLFCNSFRSKGIKRFIQKILTFNNYYSYGALSLLQNRPIALIGVDAGPILPAVYQFFLKRICKHARVLTVRNEESRDFLVSMGIEASKILLTTDSALAINSFEMPGKYVTNLDPKFRYVLVHVTKDAKMEQYCRQIVPAISKVFEEDENVRYIITDDFMIDNPFIELTKNILPSGKTFVHEYQDPFELLDVVKGCDTIITPKLHLGVYGCVYQKTVFSFPVHPEKTKRFYKQIGYDTHCNSLENTSYEEAIRILESGKNELGSVPLRLTELAEENFEMLDAFCNSI